MKIIDDHELFRNMCIVLRKVLLEHYDFYELHPKVDALYPPAPIAWAETFVSGFTAGCLQSFYDKYGDAGIFAIASSIDMSEFEIKAAMKKYDAETEEVAIFVACINHLHQTVFRSLEKDFQQGRVRNYV